MKRRTVILGAGMSTVALAGCFDSGDTGQEEPRDGASDEDTARDEDTAEPDPEAAGTESDLEDALGLLIEQLNDGNTDAANDLLHPDSPRSFSQDSLPQEEYAIEELETTQSEADQAVLRVVLSDDGETATFEYAFQQQETAQWNVFDWTLHRGWGDDARDPDAEPAAVLRLLVEQLNDGNTGTANDLLHPDSPRSFAQNSLPQEEYTIENVETTESGSDHTVLRVVLGDDGDTATFEYALRQAGSGRWDIYDWELTRDWRDDEDDRDPDANPEAVLRQLIDHLNDGNTGAANDLLHPDSSRLFSQNSLPQEEYAIEALEITESGTDHTVLRAVLGDGGETATIEYTLRESGAKQWDVYDWEFRRNWGDEESNEDERDPDADPEDVLHRLITQLNDGNTGSANDLLHPDTPRSFSQDSLPQEEYTVEEIEAVDSGTDRILLEVVLSDDGDTATFEYTLRQSDAGQWDIYDWELHRDWGDEESDEDDPDPDADPEDVLRRLFDHLNDGDTGGASDLLHPESARSFSQDSLPQEAYVVEGIETIDSGTDRTVLQVLLSDDGETATFEYTLRPSDTGQWHIFDWEPIGFWS